MQSALASPWIRFFYIAGILSATFHLAAGLWTFSRTWGLARSPRASAALAVLATAVFVVLSAMGLRSLEAFRL